MPAQSSTDFLTRTLRLYHKKSVPSKSASGRLNLRGRFSIPNLFSTWMEMLPAPFLLFLGQGTDLEKFLEHAPSL
jgi:hypothetical protein